MTTIVILTSDAGLGHRHAARALADALTTLDRNATVHIKNPMRHEQAPGIIQTIEDTYSGEVTENTGLYSLAYNLADTEVFGVAMQSAMRQILREAMETVLRETQPDVLVSTYPLYSEPSFAAIEALGRPVAYGVVVTDLGGVPNVWYTPDATMLYAPTAVIAEQARDHGVPDERIQVTGLPVDPAIAHMSEEPAALRRELGWQPEVVTGLIVGGPRTSGVEAIVRGLREADVDGQYVVIAGGDDELHETLLGFDLPENYHLYSWVEDMPPMMHAAGFIVTKAGGIIVSEALACGLPIIVAEALPGQEVGNAEYVTENRAGVWPRNTAGIVDAIRAWAAGGLADYRSHAGRLGKPEAAYTIGRSLLQLAD